MARFLVVDDSKLARTQLKSLIEELGHEVIAEAKDGLEGYDMYMSHKPDIVTLDNIMPNMGGTDCLKKIITADPNAKVIMVSSIGKNTTIKEQISIGASNFVTKPYEKETISKVFEEVLAKK